MVKIIWLWFPNHLPHHKHCKGLQEVAKSNSGQVLRQWGSVFHSLCQTSISIGIIPKLWKNTPHWSLSTHSSSKLHTENTDDVKAYFIDTIHRHRWLQVHSSCHLVKVAVDTVVLSLLSSHLLHRAPALQQFAGCCDTSGMELSVSKTRIHGSAVQTVEDHKHLDTIEGILETKRCIYSRR